MTLGEINKLKVERISDLGYMLTDGESEVLMHFADTDRKFAVGDEVDVYIYSDHKRRMCASTQTPLIKVGKPEFLRVVDVSENLGIFLDCGMKKDLLLSADDIPFDKEFYPFIGDYLFVMLKTTNNNFRAKFLPKSAYYDYLTPERSLTYKEKVTGYVASISEQSITLFTKDGIELYLSKGYLRDKHRIGEAIECEVIKKIDERKYHSSIIEKKDVQMDIDSKKIYQYIKEHKTITLTDKSDPMEIYRTFQMSKASYKRALGRLYKEGLINLTDEAVSLRIE